MAAAAMDAALASLRSAMESLLEEKLAAALAEMEVLRADTSRLKLEQARKGGVGAATFAAPTPPFLAPAAPVSVDLCLPEALGPRVARSTRQYKSKRSIGEGFGWSRWVRSFASVAAKGMVQERRGAGPLLGAGGRASDEAQRDRLGGVGGKNRDRGPLGELETQRTRWPRPPTVGGGHCESSRSGQGHEHCSLAMGAH